MFPFESSSVVLLALALVVAVTLAASVRAVVTDGYHRIPVDPSRTPAMPGFWDRRSERRATRRAADELQLQLW